MIDVNKIIKEAFNKHADREILKQFKPISKDHFSKIIRWDGPTLYEPYFHNESDITPIRNLPGFSTAGNDNRYKHTESKKVMEVFFKKHLSNGLVPIEALFITINQARGSIRKKYVELYEDIMFFKEFTMNPDIRPDPNIGKAYEEIADLNSSMNYIRVDDNGIQYMVDFTSSFLALGRPSVLSKVSTDTKDAFGDFITNL